MTVAAEAAGLRSSPQAERRVWRWPTIDLALCGLLVLAAGLARLPNLDLYTISFPEGIRAAQLQLMAAGYRPCVEIFCNQGPLLFYAIYPSYALFGGTAAGGSLEAVRSGIVIFSLIGIAATYWVGHLLGGRVAAVLAGLLVALSPTYLKFSRLALAEVPAEAPAILAVGAALMFSRTGRDRWLIAAALLTAFSLLLKPVTLAVCAPVGLAVLLRAERRWRNVALLVAVTAAGIVLPTLVIGFSEILEQVVAFRLRSRSAEGRGIGWNWSRIVEELSADRPGLFAFAVAGGIILLARLRAAALPILIWLPASLLLLLVHTPLHGKHIVTLIPPAALLAAGGAGQAWALFRQARRTGLPSNQPWLPRAAIGLSALGLAAYLVFAPSVVARNADLLLDPDPLENEPPAYWYPEAASTLRAITDPTEMIVTDHPYITFRAGRLVPPPLVESSVTRVLAGSLTPEDTIAEATRYNAQAVLLWADKITTMREVKSWVDRSFVAVRAYAADGEAIPTLYVRPDRVARATAALASITPRPVQAEYEGGIRIQAFGFDHPQLAPGDVSAVNVQLVAVGKPAASYRAVFQLRGSDGDAWKSDELAIGGLGPGSAGWSDGRTMSLGALMRLPRTTKPGEYSLSMRLYDPRARRFMDSTVQGAEPGRDDPKGVTLTTVTVVASPAR
ncbi:MAG: glycosyltransferase family 39 protein [Chloroflexi bacterium]|nr:glycosyltransferase family 39 protein [Chloroflexota bacterium]